MDPVPISVVIPALNAEAFLKDAIQSVRGQTRKVAEIIVVADDCSDQTVRIAKGLGATVLQHEGRNMAAGLNLGVNASTQPWIALLDADDVWDKRKIALQWKAIETCPAASLVSCDVSILSNQKVTAPPQDYVRKRWKRLKDHIRTDHCYFLEKVGGDFLTWFFIATPTVIVRREVFTQVGLFDESLHFGQTLEFFARVLARCPLAFVARPLVYQRLHEHNHTKDLAGYWTSYMSIVDRMLKRPDQYAERAGHAHRDYLKQNFHQAARLWADREADDDAAGVPSGQAGSGK